MPVPGISWGVGVQAPKTWTRFSAWAHGGQTSGRSIPPLLSSFPWPVAVAPAMGKVPSLCTLSSQSGLCTLSSQSGLCCIVRPQGVGSALRQLLVCCGLQVKAHPFFASSQLGTLANDEVSAAVKYFPFSSL